MNRKKVLAKFRERLTVQDLGGRDALIWTPENPRLLPDGTMPCVWGFDSTSFLDLRGRFGMIYPNNVWQVAEGIGARFICLIPRGWGPFSIVKGFHAKDSPIACPRLGDDVEALSDAMTAFERMFGGEVTHGLVGFADGGTFAQIAATRLGLRVRWVACVNATIWTTSAEFPLDDPPEGQSGLFIHGRANTRIPWEGGRGKGLMSWLGEKLVARMRPATGPMIQFPRYRSANAGCITAVDATEDHQGYPAAVSLRTFRGRGIAVREVLDADLPHMWPGRVLDEPDSESPLSPGNRRDVAGVVRRPNIDANLEIIKFLKMVLGPAA
jgi:hypothetical protein